MASKQPARKQPSPALVEELTRFFSTHKARDFNRNLRCMLLDYLSQELRVGVPLYLNELLWQLYELFELLDLAEAETKDWHIIKKVAANKKRRHAKL